MKYKVGDKVRIKSLDWYDENKDNNGNVDCRNANFIPDMVIYCGDILTVRNINEDLSYYHMEGSQYAFKDEMIDCLVERNGKTYPYKIGDRVILKGNNRCATITDLKYNSWGNLSYYIKIDNDKDISIDYPTELLLPYDNMFEELVEEEMISENGLLDEYEELTDRAFKGGYEKCKSDILLNGYELPEGYIFKDQAGNEIHALKIVLEKANTLKTQSDNMETETHRGYYTTEEETTNKSKKVAWFTFGDNDFADKVELNLSNRELIQEDDKWFVVKKKSKYPKTYEECCEIVGCLADYVWGGYKQDLFQTFHMLYICRDAYWKIAGEEMGLGKPWSPIDSGVCYGISSWAGEILHDTTVKWCILSFPTKEMKDIFYENFKKEIEICKELL